MSRAESSLVWRYRQSHQEAGEDPFFCLLEDDSLVTDISVTTDKLLPMDHAEYIHEVHLVILVKTKMIDVAHTSQIRSHRF
jgi:hypothetical protein